MNQVTFAVVASDWWTRNNAEVQGLATVTLVCVTLGYVILTFALSSSAKSQSGAAHDQVEVMRQDLEASREHARKALRNADRAHEEAVRARLASGTAVVTIEPVFAGMHNPGVSGGIGSISVDQFKNEILNIVLHFNVMDHGPGPTLVQAFEYGSQRGQFDRAQKSAVLITAGTTFPIAWSTTVSGQDWRFSSTGASYGLDGFKFESSSPLTGVSDRHGWRHPLVVVVPGDSERLNGNSTFISGPEIAQQTRHFPQISTDDPKSP